MKGRKALILLLILIVVGIVAGKLLIEKRKKELLSYPTPKSYPLPVEYATVKEGKLREEFNYLGEVLPYSYADVSTKVAGTVLKLYKREGEHFKKGEPLVELDSSEIESSVLALENEKRAKESLLSGLKSQLQAAQVAAENAKREYERELFLYRRGAVPKEAVEKSQNAYEAAVAKVKTVKSQIRELELSIKSLEKKKEAVASQLKYTKIRALKDGTVSQVLIYPGAVALPGKPIMKVFYSQGLRVLVKVPPEDAKELQIGETVLVEGKPEGVLTKLYPTADRGSSLYIAEVKLEKTDLKPNQLVKTTLFGKEAEGIVLPSSAILHLKNGTAVLLLENGTVKPVYVKVLKRVNGLVIVSGKLKPGEKVAVGRESKLLEILRAGKAVPAEAFNE